MPLVLFFCSFFLLLSRRVFSKHTKLLLLLSANLETTCSLAAAAANWRRASKYQYCARAQRTISSCVCGQRANFFFNGLKSWTKSIFCARYKKRKKRRRDLRVHSLCVCVCEFLATTQAAKTDTLLARAQKWPTRVDFRFRWGDKRAREKKTDWSQASTECARLLSYVQDWRSLIS